MKLRTLNAVEIKSIYDERMVEDFPPYELKPYAMIRQSLAEGIYVCYGMVDEVDNILAYAYCVRIPSNEGELYLIDYLAVAKNIRGQGHGSTLLKLLSQELGSSRAIIIETENPSYGDSEEERATRQRRFDYYINNGIVDSGASEFFFGMEYKLLSMPTQSGVISEQNDMFRLIDIIYRTIIPKRIYDKELVYHRNT